MTVRENGTIDSMNLLESSTNIKHAVNATQLLHAHYKDGEEGARTHVCGEGVENSIYTFAILQSILIR